MHEPCVMLSTIIEDLCYMSAENGAVLMNSMPSMSRSSYGLVLGTRKSRTRCAIGICHI